VLAYPKPAARIAQSEADELVVWIERGSVRLDDPNEPPPVTSPDPDDDYLIALAASSRSVIVTGDSDLLQLADRIPVESPATFINRLESS